jgi:hypothetical protein
MFRTSLLMLTLMLASLLFILATSTNAFAQAGQAGNETSRSSHQLEALAEAGVGFPRFWSGTPTNVHVGTSITGSLLVYLGRGCSVGVATEWTRLSWTTNSWAPYNGQRAHFDTIVVGPEGRFTFNQNGNILPHVYAGLGIGSLSVSATDLGGKLSGGPAARAGIGIDFRVMPRVRVGVSAGMSLMTTGITASMGPPGYVGPGVPTDPGNVWSLRFGGRGEFL